MNELESIPAGRDHLGNRRRAVETLPFGIYRPLSLYPLKLQEVIADVLKVKPEPKTPKAQSKSRKKAARRK